MRVRVVSRASDLAVLQAKLVARALTTRWPELEIVTLTRSSLGDRDDRIGLWDAADKGVFTADLSTMVARGDADLAVHSWKDLPADGNAGTRVAGTLPRADARDVLLFRREALGFRPSIPIVLTSSPRRAWQLGESLGPLLPWPVTGIEPRPIRGNIPTRLKKLHDGDGDALVVAKAALDRLLSDDAPADVRESVQRAVDACAWMVLPLREFPTAAAQGALAIEVAAARSDVIELVRAVSDERTRAAVDAERTILASHGGGCREAIGATVMIRDYGVVTSVRGKLEDGSAHVRWTLETDTPAPPRASADATWPRPQERNAGTRRTLPVELPPHADGLFVARAEALPLGVTPSFTQVVWTTGTPTWGKLAARGVWVQGCQDGLGESEPPAIDLLAGRTVSWTRLTHAGTTEPDALATYEVEVPLPDDLGARTHFFWTSGTLFRRAIARFPAIRDGWHASGPGRTSSAIREVIGASPRVSIWLDYDHWHRSVIQ